jgi:hypothetical protein
MSLYRPASKRAIKAKPIFSDSRDVQGRLCATSAFTDSAIQHKHSRCLGVSFFDGRKTSHYEQGKIAVASEQAIQPDERPATAQ